MAKPTQDPKWATTDDPANIIEPSAGAKLNGITSGGIWAREHLNWMFNSLSKWVDWIRDNVRSNTENDARYLLESNNLSDLTSVATAVDNLGLRDNTENDDRYVQHTEVVNNLTSTDTDKPLSANQGNVLDSAIDNTNLLIRDSVIGVNQSFVDKGPARAVNITYTNSSLSAIFVNVTASRSSSDPFYIIVSIGGSPYVNMGQGTDLADEGTANAAFVVPAGATYQVRFSHAAGSSPSLSSWYEFEDN